MISSLYRKLVKATTPQKMRELKSYQKTLKVRTYMTPTIQKMMSICDDLLKGTPEHKKATLALIEELRKACDPAHVKAFAAFDRAMHAKEVKLGVHVGARSNRAGRAVTVDPRFNDYINLDTLGDDVELDTHGNPLGGKYGLGKPGAFEGERIVFLKLYSVRDPDFTLEKLIKALKLLGFKVEIYTGVVDVDLSRLLDGVQQLWIVSGHQKRLTEAQVQSIKTYRENGGSLYVLGDNCPHYVDANRVLNACGLPEMVGNYFATKTVRALDPETTGGFNSSHPILRGVVEADEGHTIAEFLNEELIRETGGTVLLLNTRGKCSMLVNEATYEGRGAVVSSGCFTQLYDSLWTTDAARWQTNIACYLAAAYSANKRGKDFALLVEAQAAEAQAAEAESLENKIDPEEAPSGECIIMLEEVSPLAFLSTMGIQSGEITDHMTTFPFSYGNKDVVTPGPVGLNIAELLFQKGFNPITRKELHAVIPLVKWTKGNMTILTDILCTVFTGGKKMPFAAYGMYYATCLEYLIVSDGESPLLRFVLKEMDMAVKTTSTFADNDGAAIKIPLGEAMEMLPKSDPALSLSDTIATVRLPLKTICLFAWRLRDLGKLTEDQAVGWVRKAYIKAIVAWYTGVCRSADKPHLEKIREELFKIVYNYECEGLIPVADSCNVLPDHKIIGGEAASDANYVERIAPIEVVLPLDMLTKLMLMLVAPSKGIDLVTKTEEALEQLAKKPGFSFWLDGKDTDTESLSEVALSVWGQSHPDEYKESQVPPFVNCMGPSVLSCSYTNKSFDTGTAEGTKKARTEHFRELFGTNENGNPVRYSMNKEKVIPTSSSFPLHKRVREVMISHEFRKMKTFQKGMVTAVARKLLADGRGLFRVKGIENNITFAVKSYLECRNAKCTEYEAGETITFEMRYKAETSEP